jgi:hypothetical protein
VAGQERDPPPADLADHDRGRGRAVGGVDLDRLGALEERVEAGPAEDADVGGAQADFSFGAGGFGSDFVSEVFSEVLSEDEDSPDFEPDFDEGSPAFDPVFEDFLLSVA